MPHLPADDYAGFRPNNKAWQPHRVDLGSSNSKKTTAPTEPGPEILRQYVRARQPAIFSSLLSGFGAPGTPWTDLDALVGAAGSVPVLVERKLGGRFGTAEPRSRMALAEFVEALQSGTTDLYLSTQSDQDDTGYAAGSDGLAAYCSPLAAKLLPWIDPHPPLLADLIPQTVNLWIGSAPTPSGTSSGLHHDHADNLYVLLSGTKRITLFAPSDTPFLYPKGKSPAILANGFIDYHGGYRADGALKSQVRAWKIGRTEQEMDAVRALGPSGVSRLAELEATLDSLLDEMLDNHSSWGSDEAGSDDEGDLSESDDHGSQNGDTNAEEEDESADCSSPDQEDSPNTGPAVTFSELTSGLEALRDQGASPSSQAAKSAFAPLLRDPPSFSLIPPEYLHTVPPPLADDPFPLFRKATPITVTLKAGEMLYLPCGWWHEVTSFSDSEHAPHMAFNYWMHPPDPLSDPGLYTDDYWADFWQDLLPAVQRAREAAHFLPGSVPVSGSSSSITGRRKSGEIWSTGKDKRPRPVFHPRE